jgi:hypothetical protein
MANVITVPRESAEPKCSAKCESSTLFASRIKLRLKSDPQSIVETLYKAIDEETRA